MEEVDRSLLVPDGGEKGVQGGGQAVLVWLWREMVVQLVICRGVEHAVVSLLSRASAWRTCLVLYRDIGILIIGPLGCHRRRLSEWVSPKALC